MTMGYRQMANPNDVARAVLAASTWAVLALTCHIELFVQSHYVESIVKGADLCPLFKDVFMYHWKDESQHVVLDESHDAVFRELLVHPEWQLRASPLLHEYLNDPDETPEADLRTHIYVPVMGPASHI